MRDLMGKNDNGELIRIDHTNTYEGTATLPDGHVVRNKFRCNGKEEALKKWLAWQSSCFNKDKERQRAVQIKKNESKERDEMAREDKLCDATILLPMLGKINTTLERIAEALEVIALNDKPSVIVKEVVNEEPVIVQSKKEAVDGLDEFFTKHDPYEFINCTSVDIRSKVAKYCKDNDFAEPTVRQVTVYMKSKFVNKLSWKTSKHGTMFFYKTK